MTVPPPPARPSRALACKQSVLGLWGEVWGGGRGGSPGGRLPSLGPPRGDFRLGLACRGLRMCRAIAAAAAEAGGYEADVMTRGRYLNSWWVTHICMSYPVCARSHGGHASLADPRGTCTAGTCRHETWRPGPRGPRVVSRPAHRQIRLSVQISAIPWWPGRPERSWQTAVGPDEARSLVPHVQITASRRLLGHDKMLPVVSFVY